jgi:tRNA(Ile)-lysidine synthase
VTDLAHPPPSPPPLDDAPLSSLFEALSGRRGVALAVSGGSDSVALLHLFARWRDANTRAGVATPPAVVVTVDHRLRREAAAEAEVVAALAHSHGLSHAILVWSGDKPAADLQAVAREARYRLIGDFARTHGLDTVVTAHTRDDQAETLLMRLSHGSGLAGLAAMRPQRALGDGIVLLRPLLAVGRDVLRATLTTAGLSWSEDPSNADLRFARPRLRALAGSLAEAGLTATALGSAARRLARADAAIEAAVDALAATAVERHAGGFTAVDPAAIARAPEEVALRTLGRTVGEIGGEPYGPRLERLERLYGDLLEHVGALDHGVALEPRGAPEHRGARGRFRRTLGGAVLELSGERLWVHREAGRRGLPSLPLAPGGTLAWDGRFHAALSPAARSGVTIAALGQGARAFVGPSSERWPAAALATVPAAFADGAVVAVPAFDVFADAGWRASVRIDPTVR